MLTISDWAESNIFDLRDMGHVMENKFRRAVIVVILTLFFSIPRIIPDVNLSIF